MGDAQTDDQQPQTSDEEPQTTAEAPPADAADQPVAKPADATPPPPRFQG